MHIIMFPFIYSNNQVEDAKEKITNYYCNLSSM